MPPKTTDQRGTCVSRLATEGRAQNRRTPTILPSKRKARSRKRSISDAEKDAGKNSRASTGMIQRYHGQRGVIRSDEESNLSLTRGKTSSVVQHPSFAAGPGLPADTRAGEAAGMCISTPSSSRQDPKAEGRLPTGGLRSIKLSCPAKTRDGINKIEQGERDGNFIRACWRRKPGCRDAYRRA